MPLYEFECINDECEDCGEVIEEIISLADIETAQIACKKCGALMKRKLGKFDKHFSWSAWSVDMNVGKKV